jgi:cephalosporin hydroxylase
VRDLAASLEACGRQHAEGVVKTAEDLDRYRTLIARLRPGCVVETGTFNGRSAVWFQREAVCPVVTVDVHPQVDEPTAAAGDRVTWITGDSVDPGVVDAVCHLARRVADGSPVLVVLDSDHSSRHVLAEMEAYSGLVDPGGYMIVEDGILRWMDTAERACYRGDPLDAIEAWLPAHPGWEPDAELEDLYPATLFPMGFLRRLR